MTHLNVNDIRRQLAIARPAILAGFAVAAMLLGAIVILRLWRGIPFGAFMRDPASHVGVPAYIGAISNIGVMIWTATAAVCLFAAWTIWRANTGRESVHFLAWSGLGTLYLALDDVMQLHEYFIPKLTGFSEPIIFGAYFASFVLYFGCFHAAILRAEYAVFGIALLFLGLSVAVDLAQPLLQPIGDVRSLLEDGPKLIGIIFWLIFHVRTGANALSRVIGTSPRTAASGRMV